jgi:hypothetical protein
MIEAGCPSIGSGGGLGTEREGAVIERSRGRVPDGDRPDRARGGERCDVHGFLPGLIRACVPGPTSDRGVAPHSALVIQGRTSVRRRQAGSLCVQQAADRGGAGGAALRRLEAPGRCEPNCQLPRHPGAEVVHSDCALVGVPAASGWLSLLRGPARRRRPVSPLLIAAGWPVSRRRGWDQRGSAQAWGLARQMTVAAIAQAAHPATDSRRPMLGYQETWAGPRSELTVRPLMPTRA